MFETKFHIDGALMGVMLLGRRIRFYIYFLYSLLYLIIPSVVCICFIAVVTASAVNVSWRKLAPILRTCGQITIVNSLPTHTHTHTPACGIVVNLEQSQFAVPTIYPAQAICVVSSAITDICV